MKVPNYYHLLALVLISLLGYGFLGYGIERSNFAALVVIFGILFLCYYWAIKWLESDRELFLAVAAAIVFRAVLLFAVPNLSDDFFRFIWDGNLWVNGINPFLHAPEYYLQDGLPAFLPADLYENLNSKAYYTVYPPVNQFVFGLAASLFGTDLQGNVVVMKLIFLGFEIGSLAVMRRLLDHFGLSLKWLLIYALNPLIILELTGNLHFEAIMIFFLLFGYYLFLKKRRWLAAICFMLAVNTKLVPLILMPYLVFSLGWKRSWALVIVLTGGTLLLHLPFLNEAFIQNLGNSLGLYFQSFEFNASIYYLVRWIGFQTEGYNIIQTAAPRLAVLSAVIITIFSWFYRRASLENLPVIYIVCFGTYYLFTTTVHPWYVSSLVAFIPLTGLVFPLTWSAVIPLTYITYRTAAYNENLWLVTIEYLVVLAAVGYDIYQRNKTVSTKSRQIFGIV